MKFNKTKVDGVIYIEADPNDDIRGLVNRIYCPKEFSDSGIDFSPLQVNLSRNTHQYTLRGMHYQDPPRAEAKLVRAVNGSIFDVAIDLRPESPTYRQWTGATLDAKSMNALFLPEGCAHGFLTLEPNTDVIYHLSQIFEPGWGRGVRWDDPAFSIDWPARAEVIIERDAGFPDFGG